MLLAGAGGHAHELVDVLLKGGYFKQEIAFFDDANNNKLNEINGIKLITSLSEAEVWFKTNKKFALATGSPRSRNILSDKLCKIGGRVVSVIASSSYISSQNVQLQGGLNIMNFCMISANVTIKIGALINAYTSVHHDVTIGSFTEIAPGCRILGGAEIGDNCFIGSGAVILPNIKVGSNAKVGAGAVVNKDVANGTTVVGVPAKKKCL